MPNVLGACLLGFVVALSFAPRHGSAPHQLAKGVQSFAQYCIPPDDYPDSDQLYC